MAKVKEVVAPLSLVVSAFARVVDVRATLTPQLRTDEGETELILIDLGGVGIAWEAQRWRKSTNG